MADVNYFSAPRRPAPWGLRILLLVLVGGVAWGYVQRERLRAWILPPKAPVREEVRPGQVEVYVAAAKVPAYTRLQPNHLRRTIKAASAVEGKDYILDVRDIVYRVPIVDLEAGNPFKEEHFAPKGARPGLSAGIPAGWGAVTFDQDELDGQITHMQAGDRVSVLAIWSPEDPAAKKAGGSGLPARTTWISRQAKVLVPLRDRQVRRNNVQSPLSKSPPQSVRTVSEITFAMPEEDLVRLSRAQGRARIQVLLLSGADEGAAPRPMIEASDSSAWAVELIQGGERRLEVPRAYSLEDSGVRKN